jgi:hypothetical protein
MCGRNSDWPPANAGGTPNYRQAAQSLNKHSLDISRRRSAHARTHAQLPWRAASLQHICCSSRSARSRCTAKGYNCYLADRVAMQIPICTCRRIYRKFSSCKVATRLSGAFAYSRAPSSCLSVRLQSSSPLPLDEFSSNLLRILLRKCVAKIQIWLQPGKHEYLYTSYHITRAIIEWNGTRQLGWPRRYKHYANAPQRYVIHILPILFQHNNGCHIVSSITYHLISKNSKTVEHVCSTLRNAPH